MNRREFCLSLVALPGLVSGVPMMASEKNPSRLKAGTLDRSGQMRFVLHDPLEHPFYWWPRTLLRYPIEFDQSVDLRRQVLVRVDTGEQIPIQRCALKSGMIPHQT